MGTKKTNPLVEIITIGDEILIGQIVDTNSAWMAKALNKEGFRICQISTVSDNEKHIEKAIDAAFKRADIVLMTGGLGPTKDDITKQTLCAYFHTELVHNQEVLDNINDLYASRAKVLNPLTLSQAYVPASATVIQNRRGSAPVTWFERKGKILVSMPGVPSEMEWVMSHEIIGRLCKHFKTPALLHKTVLVAGIPESTLASQLDEWETNLPDFLKLAYLPSFGLVKLRLSGFLPDRKALETAIETQLVQLRSILGTYIFAEEDCSPEAYIGQLLKAKGLTIATAESCTGGNIAHRLTSISGSSDYFMGSIVAYQNAVKMQQLGVSEESLRTVGAVSREVAEEMAEGVRNRLHTDIGIAVTGIAGPSGATDGKPIGTVWIGVCNSDKIISRKFQFGKIRKNNIEASTLMAFTLIKELLED